MSAEPTAQTAPAPHFPHTEFRKAGAVWAVCPCGELEKPASSHEHSVKIGEEHVTERKRAERQRKADHDGKPQRRADLASSIGLILDSGGYWDGGDNA